MGAAAGGEKAWPGCVWQLFVCFYADGGLLAARDPEHLQLAFDLLTALFDRVGLKTNTTKTEAMPFLPRRTAAAVFDGFAKPLVVDVVVSRQSCFALRFLSTTCILRYANVPGLAMSLTSIFGLAMFLQCLAAKASVITLSRGCQISVGKILSSQSRGSIYQCEVLLFLFLVVCIIVLKGSSIWKVFSDLFQRGVCDRRAIRGSFAAFLNPPTMTSAAKEQG